MSPVRKSIKCLAAADFVAVAFALGFATRGGIAQGEPWWVVAGPALTALTVLVAAVVTAYAPTQETDPG